MRHRISSSSSDGDALTVFRRKAAATSKGMMIFVVCSGDLSRLKQRSSS